MNVPCDPGSGDRLSGRGPSERGYGGPQNAEVGGRSRSETLSPVERLEPMLHPWVGFVIMPLFAFANAGVPISGADLRDPIATAVLLDSRSASPFASSPSLAGGPLGHRRSAAGPDWGMLAGGGVLAGIGFTMALFIGGLAFGDDHLNAAKFGICRHWSFPRCWVRRCGLVVFQQTGDYRGDDESMKLFECQRCGQLLCSRTRGASEEICASPEPVSRDVTALDAPGSPGEAVGHLRLRGNLPFRVAARPWPIRCRHRNRQRATPCPIKEPSSLDEVIGHIALLTASYRSEA